MSEIALPPIRSHRTFEIVIDRVVDAIDAYGLGEGDQLPNEGEMAEMLGVSRPTVRQALRVLEISGVLRMKKGQAGGVFVTSGVIPLNVLERNIAQEATHVGQLLQARRLIEPIVVHLAAENATEAELERIEETIELMRTHARDPAMVARADGMFHRRVLHAAGNEVLLKIVSDIYRQMIPLRGAIINDEQHALHAIDVHREQLEALRAKDHDRLDRALRESRADYEAEFGGFPEGPPTSWGDIARSAYSSTSPDTTEARDAS
jgi:GntR family transcriptional repressor for pyruvate dehydrogenase complex